MMFSGRQKGTYQRIMSWSRVAQGSRCGWKVWDGFRHHHHWGLAGGRRRLKVVLLRRRPHWMEPVGDWARVLSDTIVHGDRVFVSAHDHEG